MPTGKKPPAKGKAKPKSPAAKIKRGLKGAVAYAKGDKAKATVRTKPKKPMGRPSLYKGEETIRKAEGFALLGYTNDEIADALGVHRATLYEWLADAGKADFADALTRARAPVDVEVAQSLLTRARGGMVEEEQAIKLKTKGGGESVKVVTVKKYVPPDTSAAIYWMNNRQKDHWKHFKAHEHSGPGGSPIQHEIVNEDKIVDAMVRIAEILK